MGQRERLHDLECRERAYKCRLGHEYSIQPGKLVPHRNERSGPSTEYVPVGFEYKRADKFGTPIYTPGIDELGL